MDRQLEILPGLLLPLGEVEYRFSRSGGPGGQNVNKVETQVEAGFPVSSSRAIPDPLRALLLEKLGGRLDEEGWLRVTVSESRSQFRNREIALERLAAILREALRRRKTRKASRPTAASRLERVRRKKLHGEKKRGRASSRSFDSD